MMESEVCLMLLCFAVYIYLLIEVQLIYSVVLISDLEQSDSIIHIYIIFHIIFHYTLL